MFRMGSVVIRGPTVTEAVEDSYTAERSETVRAQVQSENAVAIDVVTTVTTCPATEARGLSKSRKEATKSLIMMKRGIVTASLR